MARAHGATRVRTWGLCTRRRWRFVVSSPSPVPSRVWAVLALACSAALVGGAHPAHADGVRHCITPDAGRAMQEVVATGALQRGGPAAKKDVGQVPSFYKEGEGT